MARAVRSNPRVLVLDEPTASLDEAETGHVLDVIRSLRDEGVAVLFVSHILEQVYEIADRLTVLRGGIRVGEFPTADVLRRAFGRANVTPAQQADPALREPMLRLVRDVLIPAVPVVALARALAAAQVPVTLIGDWPDLETPAGDGRFRRIGFEGAAGAWDEVAVLAHLSPPLSAGGNLARAPSGDRAGTDDLPPPARRGQAPRPPRSCARCA